MIPAKVFFLGHDTKLYLFHLFFIYHLLVVDNLQQS